MRPRIAGAESRGERGSENKGFVCLGERMRTEAHRDAIKRAPERGARKASTGRNKEEEKTAFHSERHLVKSWAYYKKGK